ncbi:MAG: hypothetical protein NZM43_05895 [Saprospiraceae bacterium]|nr:hypothetical protein [Saprospiraceae bacterium]MDW8483841.1 hypothetical protein [Saprospiraceae bacterium]
MTNAPYDLDGARQTIGYVFDKRPIKRGKTQGNAFIMYRTLGAKSISSQH